jgi:hypothetical protein
MSASARWGQKPGTIAMTTCPLIPRGYFDVTKSAAAIQAIAMIQLQMES